MRSFSLKRFIFVSLFLTSVAVTLAQEAADEFDFEMILAGIKHYDDLVQSGEGNGVLAWDQAPFSAAPPGKKEMMFDWTYEVIFDRNQIYIAFEESVSRNKVHDPKRTVIATSAGVWEIVFYRDRKPTNYSFRAEPQLGPLWRSADPRRWFGIGNQDLPTYLRENNFHIKKRERLNNVSCYVLEKIQSPEASSNTYERFWIAPSQGFRHLKYEECSPLKVDVMFSDIRKGTPAVYRRLMSYEQHGEAWFPKAGVGENFWIDSTGKEHFISRKTLETKDFKVNHPIPPETFNVDIPDDAMIRVAELRQKLSKKEFFQRYGQKLVH
jgi:outer membrane lipoprotein-sorting protein